MSKQTEMEVKETVVTEPAENEIKETTVEDSLYGAEPGNDKTIDETKEEAADSDEITESKEETESGDDVKESEDLEETAQYKLELSENSLMDNSFLEEIESFLVENNISEDVAKGMLNKQEEVLAKWVESKTEAIEAEKDQWRDQVVNDKVMGGDNLKTTVENAKRVVGKYASEDFVNMLRETGYGDNPEFVRFVSAIGAAMSDDTLVSGKEFGGEKRTEDYFYGSN